MATEFRARAKKAVVPTTKERKTTAAGKWTDPVHGKETEADSRSRSISLWRRGSRKKLNKSFRGVIGARTVVVV